MSERRSNRSKKQVDYSKYACFDGDDDDFADSAPPPSKKPKLSNKENSKVKTKLTSEKSSKAQQKTRLSPEDKYDKELQAALELSISDSQPDVLVNLTADPDQTGDELSSKPDKAEVTIVKPVLQEPNEEIEFLGSFAISEEPANKRRRSAATVDTTDNYEAESDDEFDPSKNDSESGRDSDDSDDDYDGNDSDFETRGKKKKAVKTKEPKGKKTSAPPQKAKSTPKSAPAKSRIVAAQKTPSTSRSIASRSTPALSSPSTGSNVGLKKTIRNTPGSASSIRSPLGGICVKSPSSIRLGLSRNQKVKPLHPTVKLQN
ncbi:hypothetical protein ScPMuIL_015894 [Solemya velum]